MNQEARASPLPPKKHKIVEKEKKRKRKHTTHWGGCGNNHGGSDE